MPQQVRIRISTARGPVAVQYGETPAPSTLEAINNVDSSALDEGDTLVYHEATKKWVAEKIDASGSMDGGTF